MSITPKTPTAASRGEVQTWVKSQWKFLPRLGHFSVEFNTEWNRGCRRGAELWRRLRLIGFTGSLRVVSEWTTRRCLSEKAGLMGLGRVPSARIVARLLTIMRDSLSKGDATMVAAIEAKIPSLIAARNLLLRFQTMVRTRKTEDLRPRIDEARDSLMASFAVGLATDHQAVAAALTEPWSNGQTEGQITKLKLVKRQMYGRAVNGGGKMCRMTA